jgi:hypothetical protein
VRNLRRRKPFIKELLHPVGNGNGSNVATLSDEVDNRPTILASLKMVETEVGEFSSSKTATEQDGNDRTVSLAFERCRFGTLPQCVRFIHRQPVSKSGTEFLEALNATNTSSKFQAQQTGVGGLISQPSNCIEPHINRTRS